MNIFVLSEKPWKSALYLDDLRKNKMIVESCQMLSSCMNILYPDHGFNVYATTHPKHPCNIWLREDINHFIWLLEYTQALLLQKGENKNGSPHKCSELIPFFHKFLDNYWNKFPQKT